jgi:hypothetical protein
VTLPPSDSTSPEQTGDVTPVVPEQPETGVADTPSREVRQPSDRAERRAATIVRVGSRWNRTARAHRAWQDTLAEIAYRRGLAGLTA